MLSIIDAVNSLAKAHYGKIVALLRLLKARLSHNYHSKSMGLTLRKAGANKFFVNLAYTCSRQLGHYFKSFELRIAR